MINLGLSRISRLLSLSPTPRTWKAIHIAGTNGKGSVAALLSSLLRRLSTPRHVSTDPANSTTNASAKNEIRIGRFTSPHLIDRWDCITINDKPIPESTFLRVESDIKSLAGIVNAEVASHEADTGEQGTSVTEFELLTATAFEIFSREECQLAIVECGLGGRLDATNALKDDEVALSVITSVSLDHVGLLGDTVGAIAEQKAGIAKRGVCMLVDRENVESVVESITKIAKEKNVASVEFSKRSDLSRWGFSQEQCRMRSGPVVLSLSKTGEQDDMRTQVLMPHQIDNIATAISAFNLLVSKQEKIGISVHLSTPTSPSATLTSVLQDVSQSYQGRLQHLSISSVYPNYTSDILLDGAHNLQSAEALKAYVDTLVSTSKSKSSSRSLSSSASLPPSQITENINPNHNPDTTNKTITSITWIIALSQGKNPVPILSALIDDNNSARFDVNEYTRSGANTPTRIIFTSFSPVDGMPWISSQDPQELKRATEQYLSTRKSMSEPVSIYTTNNTIEALELATTSDFTSIPTKPIDSSNPEGQDKQNYDDEKAITHRNDDKTEDDSENELIVVAGSLYLVSDLLRLLRDGKETLQSRFH